MNVFDRVAQHLSNRTEPEFHMSEGEKCEVLNRLAEGETITGIWRRVLGLKGAHT